MIYLQICRINDNSTITSLLTISKYGLMIKINMIMMLMMMMMMSILITSIELELKGSAETSLGSPGTKKFC